MAATSNLKAQAKRVRSAGRNGDNVLAHMSADEAAILDAWQGGSSVNPHTGMREYFKLGKILKGVAKAAGALVGGYFGGPAGAALAGGLTSKLVGDSTGTALSTGILSGLGAWGLQSTGLGDSVGGGFAANAGLLGQGGASGTAAALAAGAPPVGGSSSSGGGMGMSSMLPLLAVGAGALGAGSSKTQSSSSSDSSSSDADWSEMDPTGFKAMDRDQTDNDIDPYSYGQFGPENQFFTNVNPALVKAKAGGRIKKFKYGGDTGEGGASGGPGGRHDWSGGGKGTDRDRGYDKNKEPGGTRFGGRATVGNENAAAGVQNAGGRVGGFGGPGGGIRSAHDAEQGWRHGLGISSWDAPAPRTIDDPYNKAVREYDNPGFIDRITDFLGVGPARPQVGEPSTYAGGTTHTGVNPAGIAGNLASLATGIPGLGMLLGKGYHMIGGDDLVVGGPDAPPDMESAVQSTGGVGTSGAPRTGSPNNPIGSMSGMPVSGLVQAAAQGAGAGTAKTPADRTGTDDTPARDKPTASPGRTYQTMTDIYNYGQFGPEHQFFAANGGGVSGPGTGQSDSIDAKLSDGEHVIDADTVAALGDGSNKAGHAKLEEMKRNVRKHKRGAKAGAIPPKAKSIGQYMNMKEAA